MKKIILSCSFILLAVVALYAQKVKLVFTQPEVIHKPVEWDGKTTLELKATFALRNFGTAPVNIDSTNFELPCKCSRIIIPQTRITTEQKDFYVTYVYKIDMDNIKYREDSKKQIEMLRKDNGKFSKVIIFYSEEDGKTHELFFDGEIIFTN